MASCVPEMGGIRFRIACFQTPNSVSCLGFNAPDPATEVAIVIVRLLLNRGNGTGGTQHLCGKRVRAHVSHR